MVELFYADSGTDDASLHHTRHATHESLLVQLRLRGLHQAGPVE